MALPGLAVSSPPLEFVDVTILNGASIMAAGLDLGIGKLVGIAMPAAWTAADLTLQSGNATMDVWRDVYTSFGTEYLIKVAANRRVIIPFADVLGLQRIKIRSGTGAAAVAQAADRILTLVLAL